MSNGKPTFDFFLLAAHESDFFIKNMSVNGMYQKPTLNPGGSISIDDKITQGMAICLDSFTVNKQLYIDIKRFISQTGQERLLKQYYLLIEFLRDWG